MNNLKEETNNNILEIFCDASIKKFSNQRTFGCAGAIAVVNGSTQAGTLLRVLPDSTNNKSEITAIYLAVQLAHDIINKYGEVNNVIVYSDSKISVFGLKHWMNKWVEMMFNGVLYTPQGERVKNQEIFIQIYDYLARNNMKITLLHCKGHVSITKQSSLINAADVFYESNGFYPDRDLLIKAANYNNIIDNQTRQYLDTVNPYMDNIIKDNSDGQKMYHYVLPINWKDYIS